MKFVIGLGLALLSTIARADSLVWSDSGIKGPKYSTILSEMERLNLEHQEFASLVDYGLSVQGRPLRMMIVGKKLMNDTTGRRPTLVMSGSTHGDEYLAVEDKLPELVLKKSKVGAIGEFLNRGGAFVFIPILNPDGYESRRRENANGVDLNRDWDLKVAGFKGFAEVESRQLAQKLEDLRERERFDYKVTVDYHCCIGALLHPWSYQKEKMPELDLARHQAVGEIARRYLNIAVGATGDILGYFHLGTTKDYYYERYGALAFTYEGRSRVEKNLVAKHLGWWEALADYVMAQERADLLSAIGLRSALSMLSNAPI